MTKYELMVIAAAAAAFVVINIIMWSIIAAKGKKARRREMQQKQSTDALPVSSPASANAFTETAQEQRQTSPPQQPVKERPHEKRSDFVLIDDIVIVHTDERI